MKLKSSVLSEKVGITQLNSTFAIDLMSDNTLANSGVLKNDLSNKIFQAIKWIPSSTKLVLYHKEKRQAIGFLCLEENIDWLYSIKYVFVDPNYRKMGLATRLFNYAFFLAKEKGAKKVNLNVYSTSIKAIDLYKKLGFKEIGNSLLGQKNLSKFVLLGMIKPMINRLGSLPKSSIIKKRQLFKIDTKLRKNQEILFSIFQRCMNQKWIDFFKITPNNLINGSRNVWQPPFFKDVLINNVSDSFALIFHRPFSTKATVEVYSNSNPVIPSLLDDLLKILLNRGIRSTQIRLFNLTNNIAIKWFKEKEMMTFQFVAMGKKL